MKLHTRRVISLLIVLLMITPLSLATTEDRDVELFTEMSEQSTTVYDDRGKPYTLHPDGTVSFGGSTVKRDLSSIIYYKLSQLEGYEDLNLTDLQITDIAPTEYGFTLIGLVMDNKMDDYIYGTDLSRLIGTPYTFMLTYIWSDTTSYGGISLFLEMHDLYGYPYNTDNIKDTTYDDEYYEQYNWSDWLIQPRVINKNGSKSDFWILSQSKWDIGPTKDASFSATENPFLVVTSYGYDLDTYSKTISWGGRHEVYVHPWLFERSARNEDMPNHYREDYVFTPNATFIIEEDNDHVAVVNMYDDNIGMAFRFDLSEYKKPKYELTYWK